LGGSFAGVGVVTAPDPAAIAAKLSIELVMQDGTIATMLVADTVHNRQFQDYCARHESFALIHARQHLEHKDSQNG